MEVQAPEFQLLMPSWGYAFKDSSTRSPQRLHLKGVFPGLFNWGALHGAKHHPRPSGFEQVIVVGNLSNIEVAQRYLGADSPASKTPNRSSARCLCTIIGWLAVINFEVRSPKIRPTMGAAEELSGLEPESLQHKHTRLKLSAPRYQMESRVNTTRCNQQHIHFFP